MSTFRKRNLRKKDDGDAEEDDAGVAAPAGGAGTLGARLAGLAPKAPSTLLSFGGDEEEEGSLFPQKKASGKEKRKKERQGRRAAPDSAAAVAAASGDPSEGPGVRRGGAYSAADLAKLKEATFAHGAPPPNDPDHAVAATSGKEEPAFRLAGSFRGLNVANGTAAPSQATASTSTPAPAPAPASAGRGFRGLGSAPRPAGDIDLTRLPESVDLSAVREGREVVVEGFDDDEDDDGGGEGKDGAAAFPGEALVRAARARRERMRRAGLAGDYVRLPADGGRGEREWGRDAASGKGEGEGEGEGNGEDESGSGSGEEGPRTAFGLGLRSDAPVGPRSGVYAMDEGVDDEDGDGAFDERQMRRALRGRELEDVQARRKASSHAHPSSAHPPPRVELSPLEVLAALEDGVRRLRVQGEEVQRRRERAGEQLAATVDEVESLEASLSRVGERYEYLQGLRSDIDALCDCLGSKAPVVEEMELHVMRVVAECAEDLGRAWEEEVDMDIALGQRVVRAALGAIAAGVGNSVSVSTSASHAASAEWERAVGEALSGASVPADVDETGRDMNAVRRRQAQEMAKQAQGRWNGSGWQRAQMRHGALGEGAEGGGSVRASHMSAFHRRREEIVRTVPAVFADVADKYASLKAVRSLLEEWKRRFPSTYRDAYASDAAAVLLAPFVRSELLQWGPLYGASGGGGFESQGWYKELFDFGADGEQGDPDADLMPRLVEQLVLPYVGEMLKTAWDPIDPAQTNQMVGAVSDLLVYLPAEAPGLAGLLDTVQGRLRERLESVRLMPWPAAALHASPHLLHLASTLFARAVIALACACRWHEVLRPASLAPLIASHLLDRCVVPALRALAGGPAAAGDPVIAGACVAALEDVAGAVPGELGADGSFRVALAGVREVAAGLRGSLGGVRGAEGLVARLGALPL